MPLHIVIVNWNTRAVTLNAIDSLQQDIQTHGPNDTTIWVVDNASSDGSAEAIAERFPAVNLLACDENLGFARGNNLALREMGFPDGENLPRAVYLLNPDTLTHPRATLTLYENLFALPDAGVVGARLSYEDGSFQHSAFAFPGLAQLWIDLMPAPGRLYNSRLNGRYPQAAYAGAEPFRVGHTLGATMMLRREVIQQTGLFDERFHMYCEEVDWSWRIQKAGWHIYCVPAAHVTHLEGQSTGQVKPRSVVNLWTSRLQLYDKHYPKWKNALARKIIRAGMRRKMRQTDDPALLDAYRQVIALS